MNNPSIKITREPIIPLNVTGAALRSVQAADHTADAAYALLTATADRLSAALCVPEASVDATAIAIAITCLQSYSAAEIAVGQLVVRHRGHSAVTMGDWPIANLYTGAAQAVRTAAEYYRQRLIDAGVQMPEAGVYTAEYWQDAAARGC